MLNRWIFLLSLFLSLNAFAQPPGPGRSMDFNGVTGEYLEFDASLGQVSFPFTITVWIRPNTDIDFQRIFDSHDQTNGYVGIRFLYVNGRLTLTMGDGTSRSPAGRWGYGVPFNFTPGQWYHLAVTFSSPTQRVFWINGNPVQSNPGGGTGSQVLAWDNTVGRMGTNFTGNLISYLDAEMDEFTYWDRSLTTLEIRDMMCHKLTGNEPDLRIYYRFDGTGNTVTNLATGGPNATINGNLSRINSNAPIGDRSVHNGHIAGASATGFTATSDQVMVEPGSGGDPGTHIFFIDEIPANTNGIDLPPSIEHYWGVFNVNRGQVYSVETVLGGALANADTNEIELATRGNNHFTGWSLTGDQNTPAEIFSAIYNSWGHFTLAENPDYVPPPDPDPDPDPPGGGGDTTIVEEEDTNALDCYVLFPSAFSPNGDGVNDLFGPGTICDFDSYKLQIFNRWGQRVFLSDDWEAKFDGYYSGQRLPEGTYVYKAEFTVDGEYQQESGYITILP